MPGIGESFEQFQIDDTVCRQLAFQKTGTAPERAVGLSTAEGAGLGAAVGAAGGLLTGTAVGASRGGAAGYEAQRRYDNAYEQCTYAKGNHIPGTPGPGY